MKKKTLHVLGALAFAAACSAPSGVGGPAGTPTSPHAEGRAGTEAFVTRVIDGDTIAVALGDSRDTRVRLIGIDTPERNECHYRAATDRMRALVDGKRVRLVRDVSETDRYGRLLRYVYEGEVFVNAAMVDGGFASAATFPPDVAHASEFVSLERRAREMQRGLWSGSCGL